MNETMNGAFSIASACIGAALTIVGLVVWFYVNRASVRANQQIQLLEQLLEEQKQQNALLRRLSDKVVGNKPAAQEEQSAEKDFIRMIPER